MSPAPRTSMRVVIIDRDPAFVAVLRRRMERLGWGHRVLAYGMPADGLRAFRLSVLVVDLALLGADAWRYLEEVAGSLPSLPIVVCTGESTVTQRVRGLRTVADDWVTKPCSPDELIARVEAVTSRRCQSDSVDPGATVRAGEIEVRPDQFQAFAQGQSLDLTRREFEVIALLSAAAGRVLEREEIYQRIWGRAITFGDRSVDIFVGRLRAKLRLFSPEWTYIHTHVGVGYRFAAIADEDRRTRLLQAVSPAPLHYKPASGRLRMPALYGQQHRRRWYAA